MKIMIGNDHGGFRLKQYIMEYLKDTSHEIVNIGCDSEEIVRYPYYASKVAQAVSTQQIDRGILICSTGIGMSILANRYKGVRASLCTSTYMGRITRSHNDSNILCLGGRITGELEAIDILKAWLETPYDGGRHDISLGLLKEAEGSLCKDNVWIPENDKL